MYDFNIDELTCLHLLEGRESDDYRKVIKVINSIKNKDQVEATEKMIDNWYKVHGEGSITHRVLKDNLTGILRSKMHKMKMF